MENIEAEAFLTKVIDNILLYNINESRMKREHKFMLDHENNEYYAQFLISLLKDTYTVEQSKFSFAQRLERENLLRQYESDKNKIDKDPREMYINFQKEELAKLNNVYMTKHKNLIYRYVAEHIFNRLEELTDEQTIKESLDAVITKAFEKIIENYRYENGYVPGEDNRIYTKIKEGFQYVFDLCRINEISINEISILPGGQECIDVVCSLDEPHIRECLKDTDNLLFVTVNRSNCTGISYNYHAVCYSRDQIKQLIGSNIQIYPCVENDPISYIQLPIAAKAVNAYIPLLSAIMLLQSDKVIFYLLKQDVTKCSKDSDEIKYCYRDLSKKEFDLSTPIMHVAKCGGFNCAPKGWTGVELPVEAKEVATYMKTKKSSSKSSINKPKRS
jgi:hypothetical protein